MDHSEIATAASSQPAPERPPRHFGRSLAKALAVLALLVVGYLAFWPAPIDPLAYTPPVKPALEGPLAPNDRLQSAEIF